MDSHLLFIGITLSGVADIVPPTPMLINAYHISKSDGVYM